MLTYLFDISKDHALLVYRLAIEPVDTTGSSVLR
jgi:hypothetical protein